MRISQIFAQGFRCFSMSAPLSLSLNSGLNILVGPNDAGKTAILDIIRCVLWTRGDDFVRLDRSDFHVDADGKRCRELLLRCTFSDLSPDEESRFLEWCTNEGGALRLHVCLRASLRLQTGGGTAVVTQYRSGMEADGPPLEGDIREYLKATYLRPLRDAERELRSGRRSRLSRILGAMPHMAQQSKPAVEGQPLTLVDVIKQADISFEQNAAVVSVQQSVNSTYLDKLSFKGDQLSASLGLGAKGSFENMLERLELFLDSARTAGQRVSRGLGYNNLLFMAAELLLLQSHPEQVPLLLIEEPEAHIHPQHQILFMQVLSEKAAPPKEISGNNQVQMLLTTHSTHLAANADLESLILVADHTAYRLSSDCTKLDHADYKFLRRFLDATKANLFFARGVVVVEGDAENILLPSIAAKMGRSFDKHGVSIVNVGHRGLFRYSRIFQRPDGVVVPIPVALVPDRDIPPDVAKKPLKLKKTEGDWDAGKLADHEAKLRAEDGGPVKSFPSVVWTFEYDLALQQDMAVLLHQAVTLARSVKKDRAKLAAGAEKAARKWLETFSSEDTAVKVFKPLHTKNASKAEAAQELANLIADLPDTPAEFEAKLPKNLVDAIKHVTGGDELEAPDHSEATGTPLEMEPAQ